MTYIYNMKKNSRVSIYSTLFECAIKVFIGLGMFVVSLTTYADNVRLVVSHKVLQPENVVNAILSKSRGYSANTSLVTTQSESTSSNKYAIENRCLTTVDGLNEICVPVKTLQSVEPSIARGRVQTATHALTSELTNDYTHLPFSVVNIEIGKSNITAIIETLEKSGWYVSVEEDKKVYTTNASVSASSTPIMPAALLYNDPDFFAQTYFLSPESELSGSDFISLMMAKESSSNIQKSIAVAILDSGFYEMDEIDYVGGYSFVTVGDMVPGENFYNEITSDEDEPCIAHATGVASVIGAKANNAANMVGAAGNVELHALEVMNCGTGYISDVANALNAISGVAGENYPAYEHNRTIKIANLSLGGVTGSGCSSFMQEAINNANDEGILVVVSAGNQGNDASTFEPANCENVVVVSALDQNANKAAFSNDGNKVDIAAQGKGVLGMNYNGIDTYLWDGTSFAAPLVTSAATYMYRENPELTPEMAELIIKVTSKEIQGANCSNNNCGSGLLNVAAMTELASKTPRGEVNKITYMLSDKSACDQQWYLDNFSDSVALCSMLKLTFATELSIGQHYELYKAPKKNPRGETLIKSSFQTSSLVMPKTNFDFINDYHLVKVCDEDNCSTGLPLDTSDLDDGSAICP